MTRNWYQFTSKLCCMQLVPEMYTGPQCDRLINVAVSKKVIADRLKSLKVDKSAGVDNLGPRLLKEISLEIAGPISVLYRQSVAESAVPEPTSHPSSM